MSEGQYRLMGEEDRQLKKEAADVLARHQEDVVIVITFSHGKKLTFGTAGKNSKRGREAHPLGVFMERALRTHVEESCWYCQWGCHRYPTRLSPEQREEVEQIVRDLIDKGETRGRTLYHSDIASLADRFLVSESTIYNSTKQVRPRRWPRGLRALLKKADLMKSAT